MTNAGAGRGRPGANTGKGVGGALVTLWRVSDVPALEPANPPDRTVVTTADGRYGFRSLGPGRYAISATKRGYLGADSEIDRITW